ncbi:SDR family oxidoreductase [Neobacillus sp. D3-1R]|uniref:SDR family oxidoreductase n=1 Tax=Neobacillus sp. D3-1R TaxID=3445778 RepID=UPI003FA12D60
METKSYFFTGFPGFICNQLIREVWKTNPADKLIVLVVPSMIEKAEKERERFLNEFNLSSDRFQIVQGDITDPLIFKISENEKEQLSKDITHVFHLAAIYDLAVPKDIAYLVNVKGTDYLNQWVKQLPSLERYTYFSTAYVAGLREGILYENELVKPEKFKNFYEETKYEAELLVDDLKKDIPVTIIRPGIVKGHTQTGETIKFDGPYFILHFFNRLRFLPIIPYLGTSNAVINLVPIDYILKATTYLSFSPKGKGKTYHLTDPNPYPVTQIYKLLMNELLEKTPKGILPLNIAKFFLQFKTVQKILRVEREALDYFEWKGKFDCSNAQQDLEDSGISCPDFKEGLKAMVLFYEKNKNRPEYQIKI